MNFRYQLGALPTRALRHLLSRQWFPLFRTFLLGTEWPYDVSRFSGTRDLRMIFDVGANIGQTALHLRRFFPRATLHCFELSPETAVELRRNVARYPQVHVHAQALGREPHRTRVRLQSWSEINSLRFAVDPGEPTAGTEEVEVTTVDTFATAHGIDWIDILKIDAQAFDLDVLHGARALLDAHRVAFVYVEVTFFPEEQNCQQFQPVHDRLLQHGFVLAHFYEQWNDGPKQGFCNALYCDPAALRSPGRSPQ